MTEEARVYLDWRERDGPLQEPDRSARIKLIDGLVADGLWDKVEYIDVLGFLREEKR